LLTLFFEGLISSLTKKGHGTKLLLEFVKLYDYSQQKCKVSVNLRKFRTFETSHREKRSFLNGEKVSNFVITLLGGGGGGGAEVKRRSCGNRKEINQHISAGFERTAARYVQQQNEAIYTICKPGNRFSQRVSYSPC
jgi:hypothetical protein